MISFSLYADDSQIILDPFQGILEDQGELEAVEETGYDFGKGQVYKKECSLTETEDGFSEACLLGDIIYRAEQCSHKNGGLRCSMEDMTVDESTSLQDHPLELFLEQATYFKDCRITVYEEGSYSEYCSPHYEIEDDEQIENSSESFDASEEVSADIEQEADETNQKEIVVPELVEKVRDGVGKVVMHMKTMDSSTGERDIGSGFFIKDANGQPIFITNYHVFGIFLLFSFSQTTLLPQFFGRMDANDISASDQRNWFSEESSATLYIEQGDQKFRIKGVRDMSLLMDLAVLEVDGYEGSTLNIAEDYSNEVPVYVLGHPRGRDLQKIKATNSFTVSTLYNSFMVSHSIDGCSVLHGISGSPSVNNNGEVIGVAFSVSSGAVDCSNLNITPLDGFDSVDFMSSVKTNKEDIISLIREEELLFYNQLIFSDESTQDLMVKAVLYAHDGIMLFSKFFNLLNEDVLSNIYQRLDSGTELNEEDIRFFKFLVQREITDIQGMDLNRAAQLGSLEARFLLAKRLYDGKSFEKSHQLFQELVQSRIPVHLYALSQIYYDKEDNPAQACRLLTYATEPVEALDDLYQEYECDGVLSGI